MTVNCYRFGLSGDGARRGVRESRDGVLGRRGGVRFRTSTSITSVTYQSPFAREPPIGAAACALPSRLGAGGDVPCARRACIRRSTNLGSRSCAGCLLSVPSSPASIGAGGPSATWPAFSTIVAAVEPASFSKGAPGTDDCPIEASRRVVPGSSSSDPFFIAGSPAAVLSGARRVLPSPLTPMVSSARSSHDVLSVDSSASAGRAANSDCAPPRKR